MQFVEDASVREVDTPDLGELGRVHERFGLRMSRADSFAVERRRGWTESVDTPPRDPGDAWDEARGHRIVMAKPGPGSDGSERLTVNGTYAAIRELHGVRTDVRYEVHRGDDVTFLDDVQWADWDAEGRLLVATGDGRVQIRAADAASVVWEADEGAFEPDPAPPPEEAANW
jgi:hypothetical protein